MEKVVLGISGGIDSAVCAAQLKKKYQVLAVFIKVWNYDSLAKKRAEKICKKLQIDFLEISVEEKFLQEIIKNYFIKEYSEGKTPNPCVFCNYKIKFEILRKIADQKKIKKIATGHYAIIRDNHIWRGKDKKKDQSYFLQRLPQKILTRLIFPLGKFYKQEIQEMAKKNGMENFFRNISESFDVCFLKNSKKFFQQFGDHFHKLDFFNVAEKKIGESKKNELLTIGKRTKISGQKKPLFIQKIITQKKMAIVTKKENIFFKKIKINNLHFFEKVPQEFLAIFQIRFNSVCIPGKFKLVADDLAEIYFNSPVFAPTPGQFCAIFQKNKLLGSGVIKKFFN